MSSLLKAAIKLWKEGKKERDEETFQLKTLFLGLTTILRAGKIFPEPIEVVTFYRQGVKMY